MASERRLKQHDSWNETPGVQFPQFPSNHSRPYIASHLVRHLSITDPSFPSALDGATICAAWALLVQHYIGENDVGFGVLLEQELEVCPVLQVQISEEDTVGGLRLQVHKSLKSRSKQFRQCSCATTRMPSQQHLCQTNTLIAISHQSTGVAVDLTEQDAAIEQAKLHGAALVIECCLMQGSASLLAAFDPTVIETTQMRRILRHFEKVLDQIIGTDTNAAFTKSLQGCTAADRMELEELNCEITPPVDEFFHQMFAQHVRRKPDAQAVCSSKGNFTYEELDRESGSLAQQLRDRGVQPESVVPLRFEKSKWAIVAMLAVAKAGGAFVSLDATAPPARNNAILKHSTVDFILTLKSLDPPPGLDVANFLYADEPHDSLNKSEAWSVASEGASSSNLLYVIFTSGSTGPPKAVAITHTAFCSSAINHAKAMFMSRNSRVFQFSSFTFDGCILEILTTLSVGGCVCVPTEAERMNDITGVMERLRVNWAVLTPTVTRLLEPEALPSLATLVLAGEAPQERDLARWSSDTDQKRILICYGYVISIFEEMNRQRPI